jgi:hypothetical protein
MNDTIVAKRETRGMDKFEKKNKKQTCGPTHLTSPI